MGAPLGPPESEVIISEFMANKGGGLAARVDAEWVKPYRPTVAHAYEPYDSVSDRPSKPDDKEKSFSPENRAFFEVTCPHRECIGGGNIVVHSK